jgi:hypothetical protein
MNVIEAQELALEIRQEASGRTDLRQIGNGEWTVLYNYTVFVWSLADWERYKQEDVK